VRRLGDWIPVSRSRPCPICGTPDACMRKVDGSAVSCFRISEGCAVDGSGEPVTFKDGMGWVHDLKDDIAPAPPKRKDAKVTAPKIDADRIARDCFAAIGKRERYESARPLGLAPKDLRAVGMGWSEQHQAYTWPMFDSRGNVIGIRLRDEDGRKWAIRGSRNGMFMAAKREKKWPMLLVVEGPTDTAAGVALGLDVVGRPGNTSGHDHLVAFAARWRTVVLLIDRDEPGSRAEELTEMGAKKTAEALVAGGRTVKICRPPETHKDLRDWYQAGATMADVTALMRSAERFGEPDLTRLGVVV